MIEKKFSFTRTDEKIVELIVDEDRVAINHMVLPQGEALPEHKANSHVHMIVVRGLLTLKLEGRVEQKYPAGSIIELPYGIRMHPQNRDDGVLEFFVIKVPSPRVMKRQDSGRDSGE